MGGPGSDWSHRRGGGRGEEAGRSRPAARDAGGELSRDGGSFGLWRSFLQKVVSGSFLPPSAWPRPGPGTLGTPGQPSPPPPPPRLSPWEWFYLTPLLSFLCIFFRTPLLSVKLTLLEIGACFPTYR